MSSHQGKVEPEQLARTFFVRTTLGVVFFMTAAFLVVRYMPSNDGAMPAPTLTPQHLAAHP